MNQSLLYTFLILALTFTLSGCGEDEGGEEGDEGGSSTTALKQGWHFPGRDCLACHNVDLNPDKHLLFGGTLYKSSTISNQDDINNVCGGEYVINFLDAGANIVASSKNNVDTNSKGNKGKGNLFILQRKLRLLSAGSYYVQVTDTNGSVMAVTNGATHSFTSQDYNINNPADYGNRLACNACHIRGGNQAPLFVQNNLNLCK